MNKRKLLFAAVFIVCALLAGCGRNDLIKGTYIHEADEAFGEFIIVHDGNNVSVTINGKEYPAKMKEENHIIINDKYDILESYNDADGNPNIEDCHQDDIKVLHAKEWIEGDYEVDQEGALNLVLERQE